MGHRMGERMSRDHYGLDEQTSNELRKKVDEIIMRDYSYLSWLMEQADGAQPETITTRRNA